MGISYKKGKATLTEEVSVEDAEGLLEWLQSHPKGKLDLASCTHLHAANLQVLMATAPQIAAWPEHAEFARWLQSALDSKEGS